MVDLNQAAELGGCAVYYFMMQGHPRDTGYARINLHVCACETAEAHQGVHRSEGGEEECVTTVHVGWVSSKGSLFRELVVAGICDMHVQSVSS